MAVQSKPTRMTGNEDALLSRWHQVKHKVPQRFLRAMESIGFPMSKGIVYLSNSEMVATSEMWTQAVPHFLSALSGVRVQIVRALNPRRDEPLFDPHTPICNMYLGELDKFIRYGPHSLVDSGSFCYCEDASLVVALVEKVMSPPERELPLTYGIPHGTYLLTLKLMFSNMWMDVRIHRKSLA